MSPASRRRRRMIAAAFVLAAVVLILFGDSSFRPRACRVVSSAALAYGLVGLILPSTVHDFIKPELGMLQLWVETGRWPFYVGVTAMVIGLCVGAYRAWHFPL